MLDHKYPQNRLKSRKSFRTVESLNPDQSVNYRVNAWKEWDTTSNEAIHPPAENLPTGTYLSRKEWVTLNRARVKVIKTASTLFKWRLTLLLIWIEKDWHALILTLIEFF